MKRHLKDRDVILGKRGWDRGVPLAFLIQAYLLCFEVSHVLKKSFSRQLFTASTTQAGE